MVILLFWLFCLLAAFTWKIACHMRHVKQISFLQYGVPSRHMNIILLVLMAIRSQDQLVLCVWCFVSLPHRSQFFSYCVLRSCSQFCSCVPDYRYLLCLVDVGSNNKLLMFPLHPTHVIISLGPVCPDCSKLFFLFSSLDFLFEIFVLAPELFI